MGNIEFDVKKIAGLAKMSLTDEELTIFEKDMPSIMAYISKLQEVDTSKVEAKEYIMETENVYRADEIKAVSEADRQALINEFPKKTGDALEVPAVFE